MIPEIWVVPTTWTDEQVRQAVDAWEAGEKIPSFRPVDIGPCCDDCVTTEQGR